MWSGSGKEYDKALNTLGKAAAIMPEFSFHEEMAEIYALQGDEKKAADKYAEVVTMLDEDAQSGHAVDLEMCKLYTKLGKLDSAAVYGQREYDPTPQEHRRQSGDGDGGLQKNDLKKAQEYMEVAMRTGSKNPELLRQASEIQLALGNEQESKKLVAEARQSESQSSTLS